MDVTKLPIGENAPECVNAVVEIPFGETNKYEFDKELGVCGGLRRRRNDLKEYALHFLWQRRCCIRYTVLCTLRRAMRPVDSVKR